MKTQVLGDNSGKRKYSADLAARVNAETKIEIKETGDPLRPTARKEIVKKALFPEELKRYVFLPGKQHTNSIYPGSLISMELSHTENSWDDCHKLLARDGAYMPSLRQFLDFLNLLKSGSAVNGLGEAIDVKLLVSLYNDITQMRDPTRGEWLDAQFGIISGQKPIMYQGGNRIELDTTILSRGGNPGINLEDWINNSGETGLPLIFTKSGDLQYLPLEGNGVTRFSASKDRILLSCSDIASSAHRGVGVRAARILGEIQ